MTGKLNDFKVQEDKNSSLINKAFFLEVKYMYSEHGEKAEAKWPP